MEAADRDMVWTRRAVTNPKSNVTLMLYIGDAFDTGWAHTDQNIDNMLGPYTEFDGDPHQDKNIVISGVEWKLTGKRETDWSVGSAKIGKGSGKSTVKEGDGESGSGDAEESGRVSSSRASHSAQPSVS